MIAQGPEDIEITSGFGPLRPLMDDRWEGSTAQNDPIRKSHDPICCDAQSQIPKPKGDGALRFPRDSGKSIACLPP
jgi:hypothetical protein